MSEKDSIFHQARSRTSAVIGYVASLVSIFNFAIGQISAPLSETFAAIIEPWREYVIGAIHAIDARLPWLIPNWNEDFYAVALVLGTIVLAGLKRFGVYDQDEKTGPVMQLIGPLFAPVFLMLCYAIPVLGYVLAWLLMAMFMVLLVMGERIVQPELGHPDCEQRYNDRRARMRKFRIYTWGIVAGAAVALIANASLV